MVKLVGVGLLALQVGRVETVLPQSWLSRPASVSEWGVAKPWGVDSGLCGRVCFSGSGRFRLSCSR